MFIIVTMQSYVAKRCPKNVRGMIFAVIGILAALGCTAYLQIYSVLLHYGAWMAFAIIAAFDIVWLIVLGIFILMGKYGDPAPGTMDDDADDEENKEKDDIDLSKINNEIEVEERNKSPLDKGLLDADEEFVASLRGSKVVKKKRKNSLDEDLLDGQNSQGDYDYDFDNEHF